MKWRFLYRAFKARFRDQRSEILAARSFVRPGTIVVDVGANKGAYLYWLRKGVGATGKVFAYEPQPGLAKYLSAICSTLDWQNVLVRDCALSNTVGSALLNVPGKTDSPGASLELGALEGREGNAYSCNLDTLDHQLLGEGRISFLKVDVEGHELAVFQGGKELLVRDGPVLLFECEARHLRQHDMSAVFSFLHGLGYEGQFFASDGLRPLTEFDPATHQKKNSERFWDADDYCNNFLFTRATDG